MKNTILGMILGISIMFNIAAITTNNLLTVKPVKPISTIVVSISSWDNTRRTKEVIQEYSKIGYIVKALTYDQNYHELVLLFEKY